MTETTSPEPLPDLSELPASEWQPAIDGIVALLGGAVIPIDDAHTILQVGAGDRLLVSFEDIRHIRATQTDGLPVGLKMAEALGVSAMVVLASQPIWYRSAALYDFFDALTDEDIFESFEHVAFYGTGMGGYGAAAFSVAAPGSDVVLLAPQATLDPRVTEWDPRFVSARRRSFTDRYGYAPQMCEAARHVLLAYNPENDADAMHSALFAQSNVTRFRLRQIGDDLHGALHEMRIFGKTLGHALDGTLNLTVFADLYRARRDYHPYLRELLEETEAQGRTRLALGLARSALARKRGRYLRTAVQRLEALMDSAHPNAAE